MGQSLGGFNTFSIALVNWFSKKRGRAMGVPNMGNGLSYLRTLIIAALMSAVGFQSALIILGATVLLICVPLSFVIPDRPEEMGLLPGGEAATEVSAGVGDEKRPPRTGMEIAQILRTPAFYLLVLTQVTLSAAHSPWNVFQIPALQAAGFTLLTASLITSAYGLMQIPLRFTTGWIGDTVGAESSTS